MKTVEIIASKALRNPKTGLTISIYGAAPPGYTEIVTRGFTWRVTDHTGRQTVGLGKQPVKTKQMAVLVAKELEKLGYKLIEIEGEKQNETN